MEIIQTIDSSIACDELISKLPKELIKENKIDFVGIISVGKIIIVSAPKKFVFSTDKSQNIKIIYKLVSKYSKNLGYGSENESEMFPINDYLSIHNYYRKNGLFLVQNQYNKLGYKGNISWKKTISRSSKIISNGNLLFYPFHVKIKKSTNVFLSECMDYILYDGYKNFVKHLDIIENYSRKYNDMNFNNTELIIIKLNELLNSHFKDDTRRLIYSCIKYFKWKSNFDNIIKFYIKYPNYLWQDMVHKYINDNFNGYLYHQKTKIHELLFENNSNSHYFIDEKEFKVYNDEDRDYKIRIDHFCENSETIFLFDSKYYQSMTGLDYKQIAYYYLLPRIFKKDKKIISALFIPNQKFSIDIHINRYSIDGLVIFNVYINMNEIIKFYLR